MDGTFSISINIDKFSKGAYKAWTEVDTEIKKTIANHNVSAINGAVSYNAEVWASEMILPSLNTRIIAYGITEEEKNAYITSLTNARYESSNNRDFEFKDDSGASPSLILSWENDIMGIIHQAINITN